MVQMAALLEQRSQAAQFKTPDHFDRARSGKKYKQLIIECLDTMVQMAALLEQRSQEYTGVVQLKSAADSCRELATEMQAMISGADTIFAPSDNGEVTSDLSSRFNKIVNLVSQAEEIK